MVENEFLPLVSIVIPVYRGANFVGEAIESALAQTYPNIEILVINDGSDDDGATERAVLSYGDKVRYFSKPNGGVSTALNMGIREMRGDYFSWLSHDDLYTPQKIERQVEILRKRAPENREAVVMCNGILIDERGEEIPRYSAHPWCGEYTGEEMFEACQKRFRSSLSVLAMLIPKSVFNQVGFFDESLRYIQDYEYSYRMMMAGYSFVCTTDNDVKSRVHKGQVTAKYPDLYFKENAIVGKRLLEQFSSDEKYVRFLHAYLCGCAKERNEARKPVIAQLKAAGKYPLRLRMRVSYYATMGRAKQCYKKLYTLLFFRNKR